MYISTCPVLFIIIYSYYIMHTHLIKTHVCNIILCIFRRRLRPSKTLSVLRYQPCDLRYADTCSTGSKHYSFMRTTNRYVALEKLYAYMLRVIQGPSFRFDVLSLIFVVDQDS